jgi:hypothetical protein
MTLKIHFNIILPPVPVAEWSGAYALIIWTKTVVSSPAQCLDVCLRLFIIIVINLTPYHRRHSLVT